MLVLPLLLLACECRLQPLAPADHYQGMGALKHAVYEADLEQVRRLAIQLEGGEVVRDAGAEGREAEGQQRARAAGRNRPRERVDETPPAGVHSPDASGSRPSCVIRPRVSE